MKRFIQHDELARDSRFMRQDNALATVLVTAARRRGRRRRRCSSSFDPMIEQSVAGHGRPSRSTTPTARASA